MKTKITSFFGIILLLLLLNSCKKDSFEETPIPISEHSLINELRHFFNSKNEALKKSTKPSDFYPDHGDIQWSKAIEFPEGGKYLIPVNVNARKTSKSFNAQKFLVITKSGNEKKAMFYHVITDLSKIKSVPSLSEMILYLSDGIQVQQNIISKSVIIHKIDLESTYTPEKQNADFHDKRNGNYVNFKIKPAQTFNEKGIDTSLTNNFYPVESCTANGGTVLEIEWFYQIYSNGVLIYEEYVYTTFECVGGLGSGGGGNGGGSSNACTNALTNFVNAGASVSQTISSYTQEQPLKKTIFYNWKIYHALTWGIVSYEKVDFERASERLGWIYKSYTQMGDASVGTSIGGTRTYNIISKVAEDKGIAALITINYSVTHKPICPASLVAPSLTTLHVAKILIKAGPMQVIYEH